MTKGQKISKALRKDLTGQKFGRLLVIEYAESRYQRAHWLCQCACGLQKVICGSSLRRGLTESCGCITKETPHARTHGRSDSPEASMLYAAKKRAKDAGLEFDLRLEDIHIPEFCPLLPNIKLESRTEKRPTWCSPSLDRFDSTKGYVRGNVWVISHHANTLKSNATAEELQTLVENMKKFHGAAKAAGAK